MAHDPNLTNSNRTRDKKTIEDAEEVIGKQDALPIVDQDAYAEYERLSRHPMLNERKNYTTSEGKIINLGRMPHHIQNDVKNLPIEEQSKVLAMKKVYQQLQNKKTGAFRKAYGTHVKGDGTPATSKAMSTLDLKKPELIELFGKMFSLAEVHEVILKLWKLPINRETLEDWRRANVDAINTRIEQHKREYSDIRLCHKRSRLEELVWLYNQRKAIYQTTKKADDHRLLMSTLKEIKTECEGDSIRIDHNLTINNADVDDQLKETFSFISIKEIVVARIAAKMGVDVSRITKGISQGYYYNNLHAPELDATINSFPSNNTYDFDRIARIQAQREQNAAIEDAQVVSITTEQKDEATDIKALLLRKLKERSGDTNYAKNSLNPAFIDKANQ